MRFRVARSNRGTDRTELANQLANQVTDPGVDQASGLRRLMPMPKGIEQRSIAVVRCGETTCEPRILSQATFAHHDSLLQVLERDWNWMKCAGEPLSPNAEPRASLNRCIDLRFENWSRDGFAKVPESNRYASLCDAIVLGFRLEPESLFEAYRIAKQWLKLKGRSPIGLLVESTRRDANARDWATRLQAVASQHLRHPLYYLGDACWWEELSEAGNGSWSESENKFASQVDLDGWAKFDEDALRSECAALQVSSLGNDERALDNGGGAESGATYKEVGASRVHGLSEAGLGDGCDERINDSLQTESELRPDSDQRRTESNLSAYELRRENCDSSNRNLMSQLADPRSVAIDGVDSRDSRLDRRKRLKKWLELVRLFDKVSPVAARKRR